MALEDDAARGVDTTEAYGFTFAFPANDTAVGACLRDYGEFSRMGVTLAAELSRGRGFLDVGANIGGFALPVSRFAASVVAIEAHPGLADLLARNVGVNGCDRVCVVSAAAGSSRGEVDFPAPSLGTALNFGATAIGVAEGPFVTVPVVRLDDVAPDDLAFVKIDVEGYEMEVLRGAPRLLREAMPYWLVELSDIGLVSLFRRAGYRTFWFWDAFVTPLAAKRRWSGRFRGDMSIVAVPPNRTPPRGMVEAHEGDPPPTSTAGFEYLRAFRIRPRDAPDLDSDAASLGRAPGSSAATKESGPAS